MDEQKNGEDHKEPARYDSGSGTAPGEPGVPEEHPALPERLAHFVRMLSDDNEGVRWKAAESLGRLGDPGAVDALVDTLWDEDARVRLKAAWALGKIGDPRAIPHLHRLYRIEKDDAREIIGDALGAINRHMVPE